MLGNSSDKHGAEGLGSASPDDWTEETDVVEIPMEQRVHIVERVAEMHARRVQAGLLALPVFANAR